MCNNCLVTPSWFSQVLMVNLLSIRCQVWLQVSRHFPPIELRRHIRMLRLFDVWNFRTHDIYHDDSPYTSICGRQLNAVSILNPASCEGHFGLTARFSSKIRGYLVIDSHPPLLHFFPTSIVRKWPCSLTIRSDMLSKVRMRAQVFMIRKYPERPSSGILALVTGHLIMKMLPHSIRKYRFGLSA